LNAIKKSKQFKLTDRRAEKTKGYVSQDTYQVTLTPAGSKVAVGVLGNVVDIKLVVSNSQSIIYSYPARTWGEGLKE
jgi:hypothetical protein